jgi:hypothetical protein
MTSATYEQATGLFTLETVLPQRFVGYAGHGRGRNNPDLDCVTNLGPLPRGRYRVSLPFHHPTKGPFCFRLTPDEANVMHGRSGFLIHGDNARGDASEGCIILGRPAREQIARHSVRDLYVVRLMQLTHCAA